MSPNTALFNYVNVSALVGKFLKIAAKSSSIPNGKLSVRMNSQGQQIISPSAGENSGDSV